MAHRKFDTLRAPIMADPVRQARVAEYERAMIVALDIGKLRDVRDEEHHNGADTPSLSQTSDCSIEHEEGIYLSALREYIEALGGRLEISAIFPDQTVRLIGHSAPDANDMLATEDAATPEHTPGVA